MLMHVLKVLLVLGALLRRQDVENLLTELLARLRIERDGGRMILTELVHERFDLRFLLLG